MITQLISTGLVMLILFVGLVMVQFAIEDIQEKEAKEKSHAKKHSSYNTH